MASKHRADPGQVRPAEGNSWSGLSGWGDGGVRVTPRALPVSGAGEDMKQSD